MIRFDPITRRACADTLVIYVKTEQSRRALPARKSRLGNIGGLVLMSGFLLVLISLVGLQVEGRLGASVSLDFLAAHFLAILGICDPTIAGVCSAAEGVGQRLDWWSKMFDLGLGYGVTLTDFYGSSGAAVREPHNSYITVIARTGIIGEVCWFLVMISLIRRWHATFLHCAALGWQEGRAG